MAKFALGFLVSISLSIGTASSAWAYIPPSSFLVKSMVTKHSGLKHGVRIQSTVTALENDHPTGNQFKVTTWYSAHGNQLRSQATDMSGQVLYSIERKEGSFSPFDMVLFDSKLHNIEEMLKNRGVPVRSEVENASIDSDAERRGNEVLSLARWNKSSAWVIGDRDKPESQLWIEKDSFLPVRLILNPQADGGTDLQAENYRFNHEFPYPRRITLVIKKNVSVLRDEATEVAVDGADLIPQLNRLPPVANGFTEAGNSAPSPLHELVRIYFEAVR